VARALLNTNGSPDVDGLVFQQLSTSKFTCVMVACVWRCAVIGHGPGAVVVFLIYGWFAFDPVVMLILHCRR
jgi:hypothetical protein